MSCTVEHKYFIGNKVCRIIRRGMEIKCPSCEGVGEVVLLDGQLYKCPKCLGSKVIEAQPQWIVEGVERTVDKIEIIICPKHTSIQYHTSMCTRHYEIVDERRLLPTRKLAQEKCKRWNLKDNGE